MKFSQSPNDANTSDYRYSVDVDMSAVDTCQ